VPTVGDLIVRSRNAANDPCQTLSQPIAPDAVADVGAGIFNGSVYGFITYLTSWGETIPSTEIGPIACINNGIDLSDMVPPYAAVSARFYWGYGAGQEQQFITFAPGVTATVGLTGATVLSGVAPYKSSAYLPDTDGDIVSASDIYRWINAGLVKLGRLAGGILDQTGVAMPAGNAEVAIPGWWLRFISVWHNGWLTLPEQQNYTWLQSPVTGIPGIVTLWKNGAQQIVGTWPQPSTPPASTFLVLPMGASDTVCTVQNTSDFHGTDGAMANGNATLYSPTGGFSGNMVGLSITVQGAGPGSASLATTISAFVDANTLTLANAAATTVLASVFDITGSGSSGFTAPGMCQIDNEIMSYSSVSNNQLTGLVRGYSGTIPAAHAANATVDQLILRILGRRMPVLVAVGQSANTLDMPQGWDEVMDYYLASKFKETEQNTQEAATFMQQFEAKAIELRDDQIPMESKQIGGLWPLGGAAETLADVQDTVILN
jgi:hypothetical protein